MSIILIEFISLFVNFAILFLLFFFLIRDEIRKTKILKVVFFSIVIILHIYSIVVRIKPANPERIFTTFSNKNIIKFTTHNFNQSRYIHLTFPPFSFQKSGHFNNPSFFSYLNLDFNVDSAGYIIGKPVMYYTGFYVLLWNQTYVSNIQLDKLKGTSEFSIILTHKSWISIASIFSVRIDKHRKVFIKMNN